MAAQSRRNDGRRTGKKSGAQAPKALMEKFVVVFILTLLGMIFCAFIAPDELEVETNSHSFATFSLEYGVGNAKKLSTKILEWLPKTHRETLAVNNQIETQGAEPDWEQEFWTPIDVEVTSSRESTMVTLCKLNFKEYSQNPHLYPMFKDLMGVSHCSGGNRKRMTLAQALDDVKTKKVLKPNGFVFHESRVGSTLVANTFASDPFSMVFSESAPPANAMLHCSGCSRKRQVELFRDVLTLMGNSPIHKNLFFKFQSITSTKMDIALEAFPETPFAFVYRDSVQTMMSHLDPRKSSSGAPCLRSKRSPPELVRESVKSAVGSTSGAPKEAWCAAHLNMLCQSALDNYAKYGVSTTDEGHVIQRGIMLNYESLPGIIPRVVLPMFGAEVNGAWLHKMTKESKQYSKGRSSNSRIFKGDSEDKEEHATEEIEKFASVILDPSYEKLLKISEESVRAVKPAEFQAMILTEEETDSPHHKRNWKYLKTIPEHTEAEVITGHVEHEEHSAYEMKHGALRGAGLATHSRALDRKDFVAWSPFSNTHSSRTLHEAECPEFPVEGYPVPYHMTDIVENWNPDNTDIPPFHYDSLCHFDQSNETQAKYALNYRMAEVPFIAYNIPELDEVVKKWNNLDYLQRRLGHKKYRIEKSESNHFMYWNTGGHKGKSKSAGWTAPTTMATTSFEQWMEVAVKGQNITLENRDHQYFRVSSDMGSPWLFDELPFFEPKKSLMMVEPKEQRGIHCRFGMRSVIAEAHFDGSRNAVVEIGGLRRWILAHPNQCVNMHMLPRNHPSGRHSDVDWSKPDIEKYPNFAKIMGNEVILQPGDFLYVPTYWIHYIVSLNVNFQCNTRSGRSPEYDQEIHKCGF
jgi:hypothetical protein